MENLRNHIPKGWTIKKLGEICEKISNGANVKQFEKKIGLPISRIETIWNEFIDFSRVKYVSENDKAFIDRYALKNNDILFSHINSDFHLGKTAIYKYEHVFPLIHGVNLLLMRPRKDISADFLNYQLKYLRTKGLFASVAQRAVNQSSINQAKLKKFDIVIPQRVEQENIVAKIEELFSELDKGKQQLEIARKQLKAYRQSLLKWAFEGRLTNKGVKEGELPKGWVSAKLGEICKLVGGVTKGRDLDGKETIELPYLRVANVQDGYLNLKEIKTITVLSSDLEKYRLLYGDILYTEGGDKDKLGRGTIWKDEIKNCIHQNHIFRARPDLSYVNPKFISYYSQTKSAKRYFFKNGKQTTNLASINMTILSNLPLILPSLDEQNLIVQELERRLTVCEKLEEAINWGLQHAESMRQSVLKKAFEGTLVNVDKAALVLS